MPSRIKSILIDFGGVIAEEGFYEGLLAIGKRSGLDPELFFKTVDALIDETGYLTGAADEAAFWNTVRTRTGVRCSDDELRLEIIDRFVLRPDMIAVVDRLRSQGYSVAMLSDQTDWLELIDSRTGLFRHFDRVFNSFRTHKSKRDASVFRDVCAALGVAPAETLFIDDNINHINRAQGVGLCTIHFSDVRDFMERLGSMLGAGAI